MTKQALLALEDGSVYHGSSFGSTVEAIGEVVFNTSMAGYQEILTDPSYAGQIVVPTYPLIGNYGTNREDNESIRVQVTGFVVRQACPEPSHYLSKQNIYKYLGDNNTPALYGVDTRAITRQLRSAGVMMGMLTTEKTAEEALATLKEAPSYEDKDFVKKVSTPASYQWPRKGQADYKIALLDCGVKFNIMRILSQMGCAVTALPCTTSAEDILKLNPDGVLLSPGPGNPQNLDYIVETAQGLMGKVPIMGICLGNQIIARAFGAKTFKLKFGHRGGNHPSKDLLTGRVHITAQNHGYAVDEKTLIGGLEVSHVNLNDGTVEGVRHKKLPVFGIQYHSEASPGPLDNRYMFERFLDMVGEHLG
jgi:carbamoyl-phosphate synthase small subunit